MRKELRKKVISSLVIFLFLLLSSCGWLKREQITKQMGNEVRQAELELEAREFQKAIDIYKKIYREYPQDSTVRSGYIKTLESIKSSGDRAFERDHFELAGNIYEILAKNWSGFADFSQSLSFNRDFLEKKIKTCRSLFSEKQARLYLEAGEFQKAIDVYNEIYRKYPQDSRARSRYVKTLESIKSRADRAFERSDFAPAGCIYSILLKNLSSVTALSQSFSFDRRVLTTKMRSCKKILFASGLEQYRSGNLNQAISIWKSILAFDPENQEIRRAVEMATLQSRNLEKVKQ